MDLQGLGNRAADYGRRFIDWCRGFLVVVKEATGGKIMPILLGFLATKAARWGVLFASVIIAWFGFASHYRKQGAERVTAQIEKKVEANAQKAEKVRESVSTVPASGLRDVHTRD